MSQNRRDFLTSVLKGVAYSAPVVHSLAAPDGLLGQHSETTGKGGMGKGMLTSQTSAAITGDQSTESLPDGSVAAPGGRAPWEIPPPGGKD